MHLASFSFSASATVRGPPENDTVFLLMDEILVDGFITQGEPLLVTQPADLVAEVEDSWSHVVGNLGWIGFQVWG